MANKKKSFEGVGIPTTQTPTEVFLGIKEEANPKAKVYATPIAILQMPGCEPIATLSESDARSLEETNAEFDQELFLENLKAGVYKNIPTFTNEKDLNNFINTSEIESIIEQEDPIKRLDFLKHDTIESAYSLKASKELQENIKALAMVKHLSIKELIIEAITDYCKNNEEDYRKALELVKYYLK